MEEPMTLIERLRNPARVSGMFGEPALLDVERALSVMKEAADEIEALRAVAGKARPRHRDCGEAVMERADIVDVLEKALTQDGLRPGTADSDVNVFDEEIAVSRAVIKTALLEIKALRAVAGKAYQKALWEFISRP